MMMMRRRRMITMEDDDGDADDDYGLWMTRIVTMTTFTMARMMSPYLCSIKTHIWIDQITPD